MSESIYDVPETQILTNIGASVISILSTIILFIYAFKTTSLSLNNNLLILWRAAFDMLYSISTLCSSLFPDVLTQGCLNGYQWLASLTEFSMIGSELCFLFFTFNFVLILRNPFLHIRRLMKKQYPVILLVSLAYGIALPFFQVQSNSPFGHCWIHTESTFFDTNMIWFFYIPFTIIYIIIIFCHFYSFYLQNNNESQYMNVISVYLYKTIIYIYSYTFYWLCVLLLFIISYLHFQTITITEQYISIFHLYSLLLSILLNIRGFFNLILYIFYIHCFKIDENITAIFNNDLSKYLREELLLYIAKGIEACLSVPLGYLSYTEYDYTEINRIRLQKEGKNSFVSFNDYAPKVFAYIRQFYGIDNEEYKHAVTHYIQENIQKSGAFIYYSHDYRYVVKTIKKSDKEKFLSILPLYLNYLTQNKYTFITKIYGLYSIKLYSEEIYLLVMNNFLFYKSRDGYRLVPEKYDLKGSYVNRTALLSESSYKCIYCQDYFNITKPSTCLSSPYSMHVPDITFKDCDLSVDVHIDELDVYDIHKRILDDTTFLMSNHIMDYSLLLGIYSYENKVRFTKKLNQTINTSKTFYHRNSSEESTSTTSFNTFTSKLKNIFHLHPKPKRKRQSTIFSSLLEESDNSRVIELNNVSAFLFTDPTAQEEPEDSTEDKHLYCENENSYLSKSRDCRYFIGIIDIFQEYNVLKQSEFYSKTILLHKDKDGISSINPLDYRNRFITNVVERVFPLSETNPYASMDDLESSLTDGSTSSFLQRNSVNTLNSLPSSSRLSTSHLRRQNDSMASDSVVIDMEPDPQV